MAAFQNRNGTHPLLAETESALFLKKLLAVSVSNVAYLRGLFNESAFGDRMLEDISLKILKDKSGHPGACTLIGWVKSCFEVRARMHFAI